MDHQMPRCFAVATALALATLTTLAAPAQAQYFGRNKVQYEAFNFQVLKTEHFDLYFYEHERAAAQQAARSAERWYARLSRVLNHQLSSRQALIVYASASAFQQTNAIFGDLGEGTGGVTEALKRRIILPIGGTLRDMDHVIGHELVHAFQYDMTGRPGGGAQAGLPGATALPLWFIEGMAEYLSIGPVDPNTAMWVRDATRHRFPTYRQLSDPRFFPYRFGQAFLAYIGGRFGDETIGALLRVAGQRRNVDEAIGTVLHVPPDSLALQWQEATKTTFEPVAAVTHSAADYGEPLATPKDDDEGKYNIAPALSPDGRWLMYLSNRGLFSIELYQADARTGKVERRITSTDVNPHLQSLQSINSAGAWDMESRRFVFAGISAGRPVLSIYDVERGRTERERRFEELGEILNPTWSPDGRSVAFSALSGGISDLYIWDIESDSLRQITHDLYADLEPDWSPDGRSIAFVTDRFSTRIPTLEIGQYELALFDVGTGEIRRVGSSGGKQINPQWSPDGRSLYYLSGRTGITNVHRLELAGGRDVAITNLFGGVSGITDVSPALSVASRTGDVVFTAFENNAHTIYRLAPESAPASDTAATLPETARPATLPPHERSSEGVPALLADAALGLPPDDTAAFAVGPYRGRLSLDYVGQPSLAVGSNQLGTYVGGGAALYFSDMLGDHNLVTGLEINGTIRDLSALVAYQNLSRRLNWGISAQQVPYVTAAYAAGPVDVNGQTVYAEQQLLYRQTNREVAGVLSYPFNQARRVEFSLSANNITFDRELRTQAFSFETGALLFDDKQDLPGGDAINLFGATTALVYDNSIFGATSPILGQRYRVEVSSSIGSLDLVNALIDYRKYFMPVRPFTVAARLMHFGRYGSGGEDQRLNPLFLGYEGLVRGYNYGSFRGSECVPEPGETSSCPVVDRLFGSRIAMANLELRFPLLGALGAGSGYYGAFPLEFAIFGDAGVAWSSGTSPSLVGGTRQAVYSAGATLRINFLGFAVGQVDLVHPFNRPGRNWVWQFSLQPGF
jgi:Tol biopolymer transport system component